MQYHKITTESDWGVPIAIKLHGLNKVARVARVDRSALSKAAKGKLVVAERFYNKVIAGIRKLEAESATKSSSSTQSNNEDGSHA